MHDRETPGAWVDVWVAPLEVPSPVLAALVTSLSPGERTRARRYRHRADARRYSAARGWLRHVLGDELGLAPAAVPIAAAAGKPHLGAGLGPCFNVSHAGDLALIAVSAHQVGVDVEPDNAGARGLEARDLVCTPREAAVLRRLPPDERPGAFLRMWTAKEAYLKATGAGLAVPPDQVEVGDAGEGRAAPVGAVGDRGCARWGVRQLRPAPGYVGAVASEGRHWRVRLHSTPELAVLAVDGAGA